MGVDPPPPPSRGSQSRGRGRGVALRYTCVIVGAIVLHLAVVSRFLPQGQATFSTSENVSALYSHPRANSPDGDASPMPPHTPQADRQEVPAAESAPPPLPYPLQTPERFSAWLEQNADTPGARVVRLLQRYLHSSPGAEATRRSSCPTIVKYEHHDKTTNVAKCVVGVPGDKNTCQKTQDRAAGKCAEMPLWNQTGQSLSVFDMLHLFPDHGPVAGGQIIDNLGTLPACLPLALAGHAVKDFGVVLELGPFVGFSSRCIGVGLNASGIPDNFYVFDTFSNRMNYNRIHKAMSWVKRFNPEYTKDTSNSASFEWLWRMVVSDTYPTAKSFAGYAGKDTVKPSVWDNRKVALLSIDSAKSWRDTVNQLKGLGRLEEGSILVLMDFLFVGAQVKAVYSCWREYMVPVYSSFCMGEHWMFVVTEAFSLKESMHNCMQSIEKNASSAHGLTDASMETMKRQLHIDVDFLDTMYVDFGSVARHTDAQKKCLKDKVVDQISSRKERWEHFSL